MRVPRPVETIAAVIAAAAGWIVAVWLYWGPILRELPDHSVDGIVKDYYLADQFAYLSISRNVAGGLGAFVEPFTGTGSSIYPSAYYWLLGRVADLTSMSVFGAWNVIGMAVTLALLAMATAWAVWALPGSRAWVLAPAGLMVGTLESYTNDGRWSGSYGDHAVLWAPYGSLFSPGAEGFALLLAGLGLMAVAAVLTRPAGRGRLVLAAAAGGSLGLALLSHTYVSMFTAVAMVLTVVAHEAIRRPSRGSLAALGAAMAAVLLLCGAAGGSGAVARLGLVAATPVVWLVARRDWRRELGVPALVLACAALVVASPLLARIALQVADGDSFFYLRQQWAGTRNLALPPGQVLLQFLPLWMLAAAAVVALARRARTPRETAWLSVLAALLAATALLVFNDSWGFHTEPYRFLPYGTLLVAIVAMPWLWSALAHGPGLVTPARAAGVVAALALSLTIPTTLAFARDTDHLVFAFPRTERDAYGRIAMETGDDLTVLDRCFRPDLVKIGGGGRIVYQNVGLAIPAHFTQVSRILSQVTQGDVPSDRALGIVGVRWFVSTNHCDGVAPAELRRRFGTPQRIPLRDAPALGAPADLNFELYRVGDSDTRAGR